MADASLLEFNKRTKSSAKKGSRPAALPQHCENPRIDESVGLDSALNFVGNSSQKRWAEFKEGSFIGCSSTFNELPRGIYKTAYADNVGFFLERFKLDTDELLALPDTESVEIIEEIENFWNLKEEFQKMKYLHKRGILLWGAPGSGKTSTIQLIIKNIIKRNGLAVFGADPDRTSSCLQMLRTIEPERPIITILEDFEDMCSYYGESGYLSLLDGERQINNVVYLATTNYPEDLDPRFTDRPSRFDTIKKIPMPSANARRFYFQKKYPQLADEELEFWVAKSESFSIAHLKEMIISHACYKKDIKDVIERLELMRERNSSSKDSYGDESPRRAGF